MDKGCAWIIGIVIVIALFVNFPKFMCGLLVICVLYYIYDYFSKKNKIKKEQEVKEDEERREADLKQKQQYASEFKGKANSAIKKCYQNKESCEKAITNPTYKSVSLQNELWNALHDASISLQKLDNIVAEFSTTKEEK